MLQKLFRKQQLPITPSIFLYKGDIFLTKSETLLGKLIRFFSRNFWESRTQVNHVGVIVSEGEELHDAMCVEALRRTMYHKLWDQYAKKNIKVAIYRPKNLTTEEREAIANAAQKYEGRVYGYLKIIAHMLDWFLFNVYFFRRIFRIDRYPICSWLVAKCYSKIGKDFGVSSGMAQPDDIWDFVTSNPDKYGEVLPLRHFR